MWRPERRLAMRWGLAAGCLAIVLLGGCRQGMLDQPKYTPYEPAPTLPGGVSALHPPPGTVARDDPIHPPPRHFPLELSRDLLERGHQRYDIYCAPCHGLAGHGHGMIVRRGFPQPPSLVGPKMRLKVTDRQIFDVITNGYGVMYPYAVRVAPHDRWAIVAYIRALQLSQHASVDDLPADISPEELPR